MLVVGIDIFWIVQD